MMMIMLPILLTPLFVLLIWLAAESWLTGPHRSTRARSQPAAKPSSVPPDLRRRPQTVSPLLRDHQLEH